MDWKRFWKRLLFPPVWLLVLLVLGSAVGLVWVFVKGQEQTVLAYGLYAVAFYTLCACVLYAVLVLPGEYGRIREKLYAHPVSRRYLTDRLFRGRVSLHLSLVINLLYVALQLWSWYFSGSWWFVVLGVYYCIMALMRFLLVSYVHRNALGEHPAREWGRARVCAGILLLVNLALSAAVLMILYRDRGFDYPGIMIYVMALYTFYSVIHAVVNLVKYRRLGSPVMSAAKIVSLCAAVVSLLNLETAMFAQFGGEMTLSNQRLFIILTGAGVSITVVTLSTGLIIKATKEIRRIKHE